MKVLVFFLLMVFSCFANSSVVQDKTKLSFIDFKQKIKIDDVKKLPGLSSFDEDTGDKMDKYIKDAFHDDNFLKAIYYLYFTKVEINVDYGEKMNKNISGIKLYEGLESIEKGIKTSSGNPVVAYLGLVVLQKFFSNNSKDLTLKKYLAEFSHPLNQYCIGGLFEARALMTFSHDYVAAFSVADASYKTCNKEVPDFFVSSLKLERAKAKALSKK